MTGLLALLIGAALGGVGTWLIITRSISVYPEGFIIFAISVSLVYGIFAERIFGSKVQREYNHKEFGIPGHLHQFWLNFVGTGAGWLCLYLFVESVTKKGIENISSSQILLLLVAVIGIVGWLPNSLHGVISSLANTVRVLIERAVK